MMHYEGTPLLLKNVTSGLSVLFATLCVVDIFGVFPIIALPRAIVQCGLLGIPLALVVFGLQIYTAVLLGKSWMIATTLDPQIARKNRYPLAAVTELTFGRRARTVITLLLDLTVFGGGIPNLLVGFLYSLVQSLASFFPILPQIFWLLSASQNLQLFGLKVSAAEFDLSFCYWLLVVGVLLCPLMWLGSPRDMKWLALCSCVAVILTAILVWWCIITDDREFNALPVPTSPTWDKFISGYGMLAFQFDVHPTLMTIQVDMHRPQHIYMAVIYSFLVSGTLFGVTAGLAVWKYGGSTTANVLQVVPPGIVVQAAILLAALQLCFSSAIGHSALFQHLEDHLQVQRSFGWKRCAIRSAIVFLGVAVGESFPRFDIVMALIGGSLIGPLVFVLPPMMYAKILRLEANAKRMCTPEIYSGSERRLSLGTSSTDPRVHSRSVYYGFLGVNRTSDHRYSYIYYNDLDDDDDTHLGESTEDEDRRDENLNEFSMTRRMQREEQPVLLDASKPVKTCPRRQIAGDISTTKAGNFCSAQRLVNWFGYFIVLAGILITASSTYINIKNTVRYVRFTPPCIVNASVVQNAF